MTRTAVRRHVDVNDGRIVIRRIVVETEMPESAPSESCAPVVQEPRHRRLNRLRAPRLRDARQSRDVFES